MLHDIYYFTHDGKQSILLITGEIIHATVPVQRRERKQQQSKVEKVKQLNHHAKGIITTRHYQFSRC